MDIGPGSSTIYSFTPVRRPEHSVNTRDFRGDQEKEWTAARCHRLLRALTSRVALLKTDIARFQQQNGANKGVGRSVKLSFGLRGKEQAKDGEWGKNKKPAIRTYSNKGRKAGKGQQALAKGRRSFLPGEVLISTPALARARGELQEPEPVLAARTEEPEGGTHVVKVKRRKTCHGATNAEGQFQLSSTLRDMRQNITATRFSTYEGIYNALEALLRTTAPKAERKSKGARSLLSMVLGAVPKYIADQELLLQAHMEETRSKSAIENRDLAVEIYDELEAFGSSGFGWKRLCSVVRAHGVQVISDAIADGLLEVDFCGTLISLCIHMKAVDEGQDLLSALLRSNKYHRPSTLHDTLTKPVSMLNKFTQHTGRIPFQWRQLSYLLEEKHLPLEWLATNEFAPIWASLIHLLTPDSLDDDPLLFLSTALRHMMFYSTNHRGFENKGRAKYSHGMVDAICNTYSSLLTTICSIVLLNRELDSQDDKDPTSSSAAGLSQLITLLASCLASTRVPVSAPASTLLTLATLLTLPPASPTTTSLIVSLTAALHTATNTLQSAFLVTQIARCCGRGTATQGFSNLQALHMHLEVLACPLPLSQQNPLKALIVDSAFAFARKVPEKVNIDYAAGMDATYCLRTEVVEKSLLALGDEDGPVDQGGWRWEEGIGEWVCATPAVSIEKRKAIIMDDSDEDTPFKPPPGLRKAVEQTPSVALRKRVLMASDGIDELEDESLRHSGLQIASSPAESSPVRSSSAPRRIPHSKLLPQHSIIKTYRSGSEEDSDENEEKSSSPATVSILSSDDELASHSPASNTSTQPASPEAIQIDSDSDSPASDPEDNTTQNSSAIYSAETSVINLVSSSPAPAPTPLSALQNKMQMKAISRTPRLGRKLFAPHKSKPSHRNESYALFDSSFSSIASSGQGSVRNGGRNREWIDRAPRLGRRALRDSGNWRICGSEDEEEDEDEGQKEEEKVVEESDDELSFFTTTSSQPPISRNQIQKGKRALAERSDNAQKRPVAKGKGKQNQKPMQKQVKVVPRVMTRKRKVAVESEDELGF